MMLCVIMHSFQVVDNCYEVLIPTPLRNQRNSEKQFQIGLKNTGNFRIVGKNTGIFFVNNTKSWQQIGSWEYTVMYADENIVTF